jgi:hypothetical protein
MKYTLLLGFLSFAVLSTVGVSSANALTEPTCGERGQTLNRLIDQAEPEPEALPTTVQHVCT